ncbi:enoyl-CoA hydratase-related protein [Streptomyces benahoarensis]|uniref:Hydrogenase maturation protein n=1 Tax=Streptomyces benahoarensis TaxID=2595054 RepID=A0A553ZQK9_9ACTN|nr:enoyl-CoA hydratase-related protein [Streptomyces benahoarensis]TSB31822.1 hydrogenase maturation protein [Streptomyces benahoarensis]TSB43758.1 hydrogenase maturation protein [Streptomyces benahoarensis]
MHILLIASAVNSLTQRVFAELGEEGHTVAVELALGEESLRDAVRRHAPEVIIAPMLTTAIPRDIWSAYPCLIVHPGPVGDRGPSSLDWAIHEGAREWGVTVLQADAEMDAGDVWASVPCALPPLGKSDLYRGEIGDAAVEAVHLAVRRFASGRYLPRPQRADGPDGTRRTQPYFDQSLRRIDWASDTGKTVLRTLRTADSQPGVLDAFGGDEWYLHGGCAEDTLRGRPGEILATRAGAICRATVDGAVWIPELRPRRRKGGPATFKLPATLALGERLPPVPEVPVPLRCPAHRRTWTDIRYREDGPVGFLHFSFPGGAMSTDQCGRLLAAYRFACSRPTRVLVLGGGRDFFSNGIHLNVIEAAADPAEESWANINAMDDLVEAVLTTTDRLVVAALGGNAAAGGAMLALAADEVWCRGGALLNPHYRLMGLYGSEYWTYTLPRRVGPGQAARLMRRALPVTAAKALGLGLVDRVVTCAPEDFGAGVALLAARIATSSPVQRRVEAKKAVRERDEAVMPLAAYRAGELAHMRRTFFDPEAPYHSLRGDFVRKRRPQCTPAHLRDAALRGVPRDAAYDRPPVGR